MNKADFTARIKKIEILNKYTAESWKQSIRVILDEIELSNENLLELRQFSPNEEVLVVLSSVQRGLFDDLGVDNIVDSAAASIPHRAEVPGAPEPPEELVQGAEDADTFVSIEEGHFTPAADALHSWSFHSGPPEPGPRAGDARPGWSPAGRDAERSELAAPRISSYAAARKIRRGR